MRRYPSTRDLAYSFGPGPLSPAIKALIITNAVVFLLSRYVFPWMTEFLGLMPAAIFQQLRLWQLVTYMFLHGGIGHILFNMLALWMFGTELERMWGTPAFLRYYFATGIAAGVTTILFSILPFEVTAPLYDSVTIGASGAIFGLLLAYGLIFPNRTILLVVFPIPAKYFVMIVGVIVLLQAVEGSGSGVAHITHLGGLVAGYALLRRPRFSPASEVRYRYLRWKMDKARKKFAIHTGGKNDKRIH
ncbi:MAG: rhomboid family intramembrane serine protease [Vicinamibacterales bacterium]|nr:rhomboid family intramembrane serine protease [Vicinamibacterales bacterium]